MLGPNAGAGAIAVDGAAAVAGAGAATGRLTSPSCRRKSLQKSDVWVTLAMSLQYTVVQSYETQTLCKSFNQCQESYLLRCIVIGQNF